MPGPQPWVRPSVDQAKRGEGASNHGATSQSGPCLPGGSP